MEEFEKAGEYYNTAFGINSEKVEKYVYLGTQNDGEVRAAEFSDTRFDITFAGDEDWPGRLFSDRRSAGRLYPGYEPGIEAVPMKQTHKPG